MNSPHFHWLRRFALFVVVGLIACPFAVAQNTDSDDAKEKSIVDRFVVVLEKNPRRGTALDKVYGFHVERSSLEGLISGYREKSKSLKGDEAGSAWMIVGLLESLRGQDALAVAAFGQAETLASENYLASYYLGQSLILVGQPDKAAEALERSIQRKPAQADLLDIFQALGRVYQRAQKSDKALDVWNRLEKLFPNDARVQEQIATTLLQENEFAAALPRYESLAKNTKDKYRQSMFQMEAADIKVRLGQPDAAIKEFESLLGQLLPENWLYREVRRRIESVYLRTDDQAGLIAYYEAWLKKSPKDLEAISRLSRLLAGYGRSTDAQTWLENGLKVAPTKKELRNALISQLMFEHKIGEAIAQYEQLDKYEPNNPDTLREWGRLILKDRSRDDVERKQAAAAVWRRLMEAKPKDPLVVSQVGELFRQAEMVDEALELYQKAVSIAPDQAQYREYLGEYFHALKRKDEALATWRGIAEDKLRTAPNVARLAEVLRTFGYLTEAAQTCAEACQLDPKDFSLQLKYVDLLAQAERHDEALEQLGNVKKLVGSDEEREAWLVRDLRELQAVDKLRNRIGELAKDVDNKDAEHWFWLARAYEVERQLKEAARAVARSAELAPQSIPVLKASARIFEAQNNLMAAVDIHTKLAAVDRRYRTEYLKQIATLEQKLGRRARAIQAGRDLIAAAPGNPELYEFFSQLCFQLGETDEGLAALRRSVRVNPTESKGVLLLASALSEQFRTSEAIELYWRAFDKAANLDERLDIVPKLAELYLQTNQFDRLLERLERQRREPNQLREMTICMAQAYQSAGDDGNARHELEKLLTEETRDVQLLMQLVKLCEADGDLEAAIKFQQQVLKLAPGKDSTIRLSQLLTKSGETEEAAALMSGIVTESNDPETVLKSLDALLNQGKYDQVLSMAEKLTQDQPKNWEAIYREAVALANIKDKSAEAEPRFRAILALNLDDDEASVTTRNQAARPANATQQPVTNHRENRFLARVQNAAQIRSAIAQLQNRAGNRTTVMTTASGLQTVRTTAAASSRLQQSFQSPQDFGTARIAAFAWLNSLAQTAKKGQEFVDEQRALGEKSDQWRQLMDWYYVTLVTGNPPATYSVLKTLSMRSDADAGIKSAYLASLAGRGNSGRIIEASPAAVATNLASDDDERLSSIPMLDPDEMEHVLACYRSLDGSLLMVNSISSYLQVVMTELKRAGRKDEALKMFDDALENATEPIQIAVLLPSVAQRGDYKTAIKILDRLVEMKPIGSSVSIRNANGTTNFSVTVTTPAYQARMISQLMSKRSQNQSLGDVLELWERAVSLAVARREQAASAAGVSRRRGTAPQPQVRQQAVTITRQNSMSMEPIEFPMANEVYDGPSIQALRQMFVIYNEANIPNDLIQYFQKKLEDSNTPKPQLPLWHFGLGYLHWWVDDRPKAVEVLTAATDSLPDNQDMKLELVRLIEKQGQLQQALEIVDSLPPTDQQAMQAREITALRLAVNSGNVIRARTAAERLFGLRLDSNLQIQLAQQMHQLGMHEQAEALLARAGRQAGNRTDVLLSLMQQYQSQGNGDTATQIAYQLLRRTERASSAPISTTASGAIIAGPARARASAGGETRQQALTVLKRSGKLPDMIKRVETQLQAAPNSRRLIESLIEYATADGNEKKVAELTAKMAESRRDDPQFRFNLGQQLMNQGKHKEASEHFRAAIGKDPRVFGTNYPQIFQSFQQAGKISELTSVMESLDLISTPENFSVARYYIQVAARDEKNEELASTMFKRVWKELPNQRQQLLTSIHGEKLAKIPEIYDDFVEVIVPNVGLIQVSNGWIGFDQSRSISRNQNGSMRIDTSVTHLLHIATRNKKLDELAAKLEDRTANAPNWDAGKILIALVDLRRGKIDEAKSSLEALLPMVRKNPYGEIVPWEIAQELEDHQQCYDLAIQYYESACNFSDRQIRGIQNSPFRALVALYQKQNRPGDARRILMSALSKRSLNNIGNENSRAYERIQSCVTVGQELQNMGFPMDAIRVYKEQLGRPDDFDAYAKMFAAPATGARQVEQIKQQIDQGYQAAVTNLKPEMLLEFLLGPKDDGLSDGPVSALEPANPVRPPFDLLMQLESRDLDKTRLSSALSKLFLRDSTDSQFQAAVRSAMAQSISTNPDDFGLRVLAAQYLLNDREPTKGSAALKELIELVDRTPLDSPPARGSFTASQRQAAMRQVALWLVARECLKQESLRTVGTQLATRSLEAAKRQTDNGFAQAILREWGQLAIDAGDTATAERCWTEMLETVIPTTQPQLQPMPRTRRAQPAAVGF